MAKFSHIGLFTLFISAVTSYGLNAEELTAQQIMNKASLSYYYAGDDGRAEARMKITDAQGRTQVRQFTILRKDVADGGKQNMLVNFTRPSDVKNTVFRVVKHPQAQDDRWLYLPGLDLIKRISSGDKRTSFVGSDFFYEDISGRSPTLDHHQLIETDNSIFQINSTPAKPNEVEFSRYQSWIDATTFLPKKVIYFDKGGKPYREIKVLKTKVIQEKPTVLSVQVKNLVSGNQTLMQMRRVKFDIGIPASVFTEKSMRTPPVKWLKKR